MDSCCFKATKAISLSRWRRRKRSGGALEDGRGGAVSAERGVRKARVADSLVSFTGQFHRSTAHCRIWSSCRMSDLSLTNSFATSSLVLCDKILRIVQPVSSIWHLLPSDSQRAHAPCKQANTRTAPSTLPFFNKITDQRLHSDRQHALHGCLVGAYTQINKGH